MVWDTFLTPTRLGVRAGKQEGRASRRTKARAQTSQDTPQILRECHPLFALRSHWTSSTLAWDDWSSRTGRSKVRWMPTSRLLPNGISRPSRASSTLRMQAVAGTRHRWPTYDPWDISLDRSSELAWGRTPTRGNMYLTFLHLILVLNFSIFIIFQKKFHSHVRYDMLVSLLLKWWIVVLSIIL
jgi:hypothetical protein